MLGSTNVLFRGERVASCSTTSSRKAIGSFVSLMQGSDMVAEGKIQVASVSLSCSGFNWRRAVLKPVGLLLVIAGSLTFLESDLFAQTRDGSNTVRDSERLNREVIGSQYVPSDAVALAEVKIAETLASPQAEMYPIEVFDALAQQNLGVGVADLEEVRFFVAVPGPSGPQFGAVLNASKPIQIKGMDSYFIELENSLEVDGHQCYPLIDAPDILLPQKDPQTLVLATEGYLDAILRSSKSKASRSALSQLAESTIGSANATLMISVETVRPLLMGMMQSLSGELTNLSGLPDLPMQSLMQIPSLLDGLVVKLDIDNEDGTLELDLHANDENAAEQLNNLIADGLEQGREYFLHQMATTMDSENPLTEASYRYMQRISSVYVDAMKPKRDGSRVTMHASPTEGMATQGVLVGLLLPAVQSSRQAARRMVSMNNMKQIGLAMHISHDIYRKMPGDILADDGTPLLSWRVAVLPFIEQTELYEQFKKDEPWDSPHNLALLEKMPETLRHPEMQVEPGRTVYLRPVGPQFIAEGHGSSSMRQILDGTSNTIMVIESTAEAAVPWTKPVDLRVDLRDPVQSIAGPVREGFNVLIADGSVRYLSSMIDVETLKALLTRNGGEIIDDF